MKKLLAIFAALAAIGLGAHLASAARDAQADAHAARLPAAAGMNIRSRSSGRIGLRVQTRR